MSLAVEFDSPCSQSTIDDETASYPVPFQFKERFDIIKSDYSVNVLPVYCRDEFVPPDQTTELLNGALAEVHLVLSHNHIRKPGDEFDSFNGHIRQVIVHVPGTGKASSPYKRKNVREGPVRPPPDTPSHPLKSKHDEPLEINVPKLA
ncbi:hypothetical protein JB92DRAFT_3065877 [Gautieria morchelliformis]|nr:hypothetical protein JB92DRAFT_3065877 [Gautieria morchelliformis]